MLNSKDLYHKYLIDKGWVKHSQLRKLNNKKYAGREFYDYLRNMDNSPDTVIAYIGNKYSLCKELHDF